VLFTNGGTVFCQVRGGHFWSNHFKGGKVRAVSRCPSDRQGGQMPKIKYVDRRFSAASLAVIDKANEIIESYATQGYDLTLRQLYYQFVARDLIPNTQREYKKLGSIINDGRLAGLIDWDRLVDRTRNVQLNSHWTHPKHIVEVCAEQYQIDKWQDQESRIEVWIEKDALIGVIEGVCQREDVSYFSCRGYNSQSEMWGASIRLFKHYEESGQHPVIIHLGDHDPSGIDMTRDIEDRLRLFGLDITVERIALNMDQVEKYGPPPNPAKITDSRAKQYIHDFGTKSWELDALEPTMLEKLIASKIARYRDEKLWAKMVVREKRDIAVLKKAAKAMTEAGKGKR